MIPRSCAASRASAICFAIGNASSIGMAPRVRRCARSSPSTSSITSARTPPLSSKPWMCAMFGWLSKARTWASRWKRARRSGSLANESGSTFSATSRLSFVSRARYTSPIPPAPSAPRISYGPRRAPAVSDTRSLALSTAWCGHVLVEVAVRAAFELQRVEQQLQEFPIAAQRRKDLGDLHLEIRERRSIRCVPLRTRRQIVEQRVARSRLGFGRAVLIEDVGQRFGGRENAKDQCL